MTFFREEDGFKWESQNITFFGEEGSILNFIYGLGFDSLEGPSMQPNFLNGRLFLGVKMPTPGKFSLIEWGGGDWVSISLLPKEFSPRFTYFFGN